VRAVDRLLQRIEKLGSRSTAPEWLSAVASQEEIAEYRSIFRVYHHLEVVEPLRRFIERMRAKYPEMAVGYEEERIEGARRLVANRDLARAQGLTDEDLQE
jgi:hypothetical protein